MNSSDDIKRFRQDWESQETQELLKAAMESTAQDGDLTKSKNMPAYGWSNQI